MSDKLEAARQTAADAALPDDWAYDVLRFWFEDLQRADWFKKSAATDEMIRERFLTLFEMLAARPIDQVRASPETALAAVIVLDQFARNMFRGSPQSFANDGKALAIAEAAIANGFDQALEADRRVFLYLPFEHSECLADQERAVALIEALGDAEYTRYAIAHRDVILRFGRFPHRNAVLGRHSTADELAYLAEPGSGF